MVLFFYSVAVALADVGVAADDFLRPDLPEMSVSFVLFFCPQELCGLVFQFCLASARDGCVLRRLDPGSQERIDHKLCHVAEDLMQDAEHRDVPDLACHAVRTRPDRDRLHVFRIMSPFNFLHGLHDHWSDRINRFIPELHVLRIFQPESPEFLPPDPGVFLDKGQDVIPAPLAFEAVFYGSPAEIQT